MSIKQRMYPTTDQESVMRTHGNHARFVYNLAVIQRSFYDKTARSRGVKITYSTQSQELTELREELSWLKVGSSIVQQQALQDANTAFQNFFDSLSGKRAGAKVGFPKLKRKTDSLSFRLVNLKIRRINRKWGQVLVPKLGYVRFRITRAWHDIMAAKSARITYKNQQWHVSFTAIPDEKPENISTKMIGIDRGVKNTLCTSDGTFYHIPTLTDNEQQRFLHLARKASGQTKFSNRWHKTINSLRALYRKLGNRRKNWIEQITTLLAKENCLIVLEELKISNMTRKPKPKPDPDKPGSFLPNNAAVKAKLNKAIYGSCWGEFAKRLEDKNTRIEFVPAHYTSQTCYRCGYTDKENRENQAEFQCKNCGHEHHTDINASLNILHKYLHPGTQGKRTPKNVNHLIV